MSKTPKVNKGTIVSGGAQIVYNQANGDGAQANWTTAAPQPDVTGLLAHIEALLSEHEARLPEHEAARAAVDDITGELAAEQPAPSKVARALRELSTFAKPVTPLVSAVAQLARAIHGGG